MQEKPFHILEAQQFSRPFLENFFSVAGEMEEMIHSGKTSDILKNKRMVSLFYEPSTRTRLSFEMAMSYLGGQVFSTENAKESSSAIKGETIEDTMRVAAAYRPDVIVLRHCEDGIVHKAAQVSPVPVINAGDGKNQHPTQALVDLYTIQQKFGKIDGIRIAMVGDLASYRSVRSLCYALAKFKNIKIYFISPTSHKVREDIKEYITVHGVDFEEWQDLRKVSPLVDIVYQTRIQKERGVNFDNQDMSLGYFLVNKEILSLMKKEAIVMHPLPRIDEISPEVDVDSRAHYFKQAENGLYVRMALLKMMLASEF